MPRAVAALERAVLRGPRPRPGTGLAQALATFRAELAKLRRQEPSDLHPADPRTGLRDDELDAAARLVDRLAAALAPLEALPTRTASPSPRFAACHREVVGALSAPTPEHAVAFAGADGSALAQAFDEIADCSRPSSRSPGRLSPSCSRTAIADRDGAPARRRVRRAHLRSARSAPAPSVDRVVLGGLVEGVWPPETRSDPWLSRPMRHEARPRPAGAAHRPFGARLRPDARRAAR